LLIAAVFAWGRGQDVGIMEDTGRAPLGVISILALARLK
jgi:hypothetical protein